MDMRNKVFSLHVLGWFFLLNTVLFWLVGYKYLVAILSSKTLYSTSFEYPEFVSKSLIIFFTFISYVGHLALLAILPLVIFVVPLILLMNKKSIILPAMVLASSISLMILLVDTIIFSIFHFHINLTLLKIAFADNLNVINFLEFSSKEIVMIVGIFLFIVLLEMALVRLSWWCVSQQKYVRKKLYFIILGCGISSYSIFILTIANTDNVFAQQTPNLPLYNNVMEWLLPFKNSFVYVERYSETHFSQPLFPLAKLKYPLNPLICEAKKPHLNILLIGIDTWRFDAMNQLLTPHIEKFSKKSWQFTRHFSGGNSTQAGLFSLFYSIPSTYWSSMLQQHQGAAFIHELFKKNYVAKVFYSSDISVPPMHKTIFSEIKDVSTSQSPGKTSVQRDQFVTNQFKEFLHTRNPQQPFFAFLFYDSAHSYCQAEGLTEVFPVKHQFCNRFISNKELMQDAINHYKNGLHFVDNEVQTVLNELKSRGLLDNTIVIITGDHGEEFNDSRQGYWGHGSNYTRYQVQTPLIIRWPGAHPKIFSYNTNHYDIVPTLMQKVLQCTNPVSDYSIGLGLFDKKDRPYILVGSYINMGIVEKNKNITLLTSGNIRIADNQANYLLNAKPDINIIAQALMQMRKYYLYH